MNDNKKINVYHNNWESSIIIEDNYLYKENDIHNKTNDFFINNHFLKITWNNECIDYFLSCDEINYYKICDKFNHIFFNNYSYYYTYDDFNTKLYLANHKLDICYDLNNIELYYFFNISNNHFILYDELNNTHKTFIYFLNKYYEKSYFNKNFKIININHESFNNVTLNLKTNDFYFDLDINGKYKIFGVYLQLNYLNKTLIYKLNDNIYQKIDIQPNFLYLNDFDFNNIKNDQNTITFISNNIVNNDLIYYLSTNNYNIIYFDNIKNKKYNNLYQNIQIIYYKNNHDLEIIENEINELSEIQYYFTNIKNFVLKNKINLLDTNLKFDSLINLFNLNTNNVTDQFNDFLHNNHKLDKINYIKNSKIPKILHFIWLGDNQFPYQYYLFLNSWLQKYTDFTFCFWNDSNLFNLFNQSIFDKSLTYAQKSDIARYEILYNYGGIYVDSDFYSIQNIETLLKDINMFSAFESDDFIAIGLMGFEKNNTFLKKLIMNIQLNYYLFDHKNIPNQTGPVYFTNFYNNFINQSNNYKFFEPSYFYNYSFQDKNNNLPITFHKNNYCYHSWGYSWDLNKQHQNYIYYYLIKFIYNNQIINSDSDKNDFKLNNVQSLISISDFYKNKIFYKKNNKQIKNKKNIINIMGYFFTGGIEKFILDIDKYGDHKKYNYFLLFLNNKNHNVNTNLKNFTCIYFKDSYELLNLINIIDPLIIIDHYSQYLENSIYNHKIYQNITLHIIHSAINYNNDISTLNIENCIHLYKEENKHESWNKIQNNYYNTLGIKIINKKDLDIINNQKKIDIEQNKQLIIAIIGRIVEEKIPIDFFKKLCKLSLEKKNIIIRIYGSQNYVLDVNYNSQFDKLIENSNIELYGQINYENMSEVYEKINYLLIPSKFETGSYTCLEALSYGIPVITRNNYGLKKILKNNITGHLCNNDDEIIEKMKYLYFDNLNKNYSIIYKESLKYNILDKIKNFESLIEKHINNKNLIIITSILNISKNELSYYHIRSVFDIYKRYEQTLKTINSIKKYIPNCFILFCECSDLTNYNDIQENIEQNVDQFLNFNNNSSVKNEVNSQYKGSGENSILLEAIKYINNKNLIFDNVFKISGRYYLNDDFDFKLYNNNYNQFTLWDNNFNSYASLFYKIKFKYLNLLHTCFTYFIDKLKNGEALEILLNKYFNQYMNYQNITILDKMNISGNLSTEGYFFTI